MRMRSNIGQFAVLKPARHLILVTAIGCVLAFCAGWRGDVIAAAEAEGSIATYLERYHALKDGDADGRMELAEWCRGHQLFTQEVDLLTEVLKIRPDDAAAYRELIECDEKRV